MKKTLVILAILIIFISFIKKYFIYYDFSENCLITINPSFLEFSNTSMKKALMVLKYASPDDYLEVCQNVSNIDPNISCGGFGGGCFYQDSPTTIDISTTNNSLAITAAVIVHETCHSIQNKEDRSLNEEECEIKMANTIEKIVEF